MNEVLNIASNSVCISVLGKSENAHSTVCRVSENFKCAKSLAFFQGGTYELLIKTTENCKAEVFINKKQLELSKLFGDLYFCDIFELQPGTNRLEIYLNSHLHGFAEFEAAADFSLKESDISDMLCFIGSCCESEMCAFLENCDMLKNLDISLNTSDMRTAADTLLDFAKKRLLFIKPRSFNVSGKFRRFLKPVKQKRFSLFSKKNIAEKRKFKACKISDAYNTSKNIQIKKSIVSVINILQELKEFYPYIGELLNGFSLSEPPLSLINCGDFEIKPLLDSASVKNTDMLYKFYCFTKINSLLSQMCQTVFSDIFTFSKTTFFADISKPHESKFVNTNTNLAVSVKYNPSNDLPCIFIYVKTNDERTSLLNVYAFDVVFKKIPNKSDIIKVLAYPNLITGKTSRRRIISKCFLLYFGDKASDSENAIALSPAHDFELLNFFESIFIKSDKLKYQHTFSLLLKDIEFERKNVLTGVVKTKSQFEINIAKRFYYIPQKFILSENLPVRYVAIYQSKSLFGNESGISYYGEVEKTSLVERSAIKEIIKNSFELYYRFDIKKWHKLEKPIKPRDFAEVCMFTNMFLLKNAAELPELYIGSAEEFALYLCIKDFFERSEVCGFEFFLNYLKFEKETITLYCESGRIAKFKKSAYKTNILKLTSDIMNIVYS